jgi:hypothetical protein
MTKGVRNRLKGSLSLICDPIKKFLTPYLCPLTPYL